MEDFAALAHTWLTGFATSRETVAERVGARWELALESSARRHEWVLVEPTPDQVRVEVHRLRGTELTWLSVLSPPDVAPLRGVDLPDDVEVHLAHERLMRVALTEVPSDPGVVLADDGDRVVATLHLDGVEAARGQAALVPEARTAVVDRVSTEPTFQRRGLGSRVMTALAGWGRERGAHTGLLVASVEGQALYRSLGWEEVGSLATLRAARTVGP